MTLQSERKEKSEEIGPASTLQVTQIPPYGEVDNTVDNNAQETSGAKWKKEHGWKKVTQFFDYFIIF